MPTDTDIPNLIINKVTTQQYNTMTKNPTEFYMITDDTTYLTQSDIVSSVSSSSTNTKAVGAKLFYDTCGDIESLINAL